MKHEAKIPTFLGKNGPKAVIAWLEKVESIYPIHNYSDEKKIKLALIEFSGYAQKCWTKILATRRRDEKSPIKTWDEFK